MGGPSRENESTENAAGPGGAAGLASARAAGPAQAPNSELQAKANAAGPLAKADPAAQEPEANAAGAGAGLTEAEGLELHCPNCDYDLRGTDGDVCSECGAAIDRAALARTRLPWERRTWLNWPIAYVRTWWMLMRGGKRLRGEASKPHRMRDGRRFANVTAVLFALAVWGILSIAMGTSDPSRWRLPEPAQHAIGAQPSPSAVAVVLPLEAILQWHWSVPLMIAAFAFYMTRAQMGLFRRPHATRKQQEAGAALGYYSTAPLVAALAIPLVHELLANIDVPLPEDSWKTHWLGILQGMIALYVVARTTLSIVRWSRRVHRRENSIVWALARLGLAWLFGLVCFAFILPWIAGYLLIVAQSLRL